MSSSQTISPIELEGTAPLSFGTREYFRARLRNRLYNFIVRRFTEKQAAGKITQVELARRVRRRPDVVNRLLSAPGNWTIDTVSDLLLGIGPEELDMSSSPVINRSKRNEGSHSALDEYLKKSAAEPQVDVIPILNRRPPDPKPSADAQV